MRTIGFNRVDGYYGPYAVGQSPQEQAAAASTPAKETKTRTPWLTSETKNNLVNTSLGIVSGLVQSKLDGTANTSPGNAGAGDYGNESKRLGVGGWIAIGLGVAAIGGTIWYFAAR